MVAVRKTHIVHVGVHRGQYYGVVDICKKHGVDVRSVIVEEAAPWQRRLAEHQGVKFIHLTYATKHGEA